MREIGLMKRNLVKQLIISVMEIDSLGNFQTTKKLKMAHTLGLQIKKVVSQVIVLMDLVKKLIQMLSMKVILRVEKNMEKVK